MTTALMIIDVQEAMITGGMFCEQVALANMQSLLAAAREGGAPVIHVRHDYGAGHEWGRGTPGWQIYAPLAPQEGETIVDKTRNSAFYQTDLEAHLRQSAIDTILVAGVHTEFCIDATIRSAFERGFQVVVPALANTTHGNEYLPAERLYGYYNEFLWPRRYATTLSLEQALTMLAKPDRA